MTSRAGKLCIQLPNENGFITKDDQFVITTGEEANSFFVNARLNIAGNQHKIPCEWITKETETEIYWIFNLKQVSMKPTGYEK